MVNPLVFLFEDIWNEYMGNVSFASQVKPYAVLPGNHEAECHDLFCISNTTLREKLANFSAYNHRFLMPFAESQANSDMWYSFEHAGVHFIQIDTVRAALRLRCSRFCFVALFCTAWLPWRYIAQQ